MKNYLNNNLICNKPERSENAFSNMLIMVQLSWTRHEGDYNNKTENIPIT